MRKFRTVLAALACLEFLIAGAIAAPNVTETSVAKGDVAPIRAEPKNLPTGGSERTPANPEVAVSSTPTSPTEFGPCGNVDIVYTCSPE